MSDRSYPVGYGRPPVAHQFKPGQSGNPKGRPNGSLNLATALEKELSRRVTIKENGQTRSITKFEAAIKQLVNKAASGDAKAIQFLVSLLNVSNGGPLAEPDKGQPTQADRAAMLGLLRRLQGKAAPSPSPSNPSDAHEAEP